MIIRPAIPGDIPSVLLIGMEATKTAHWPAVKYREMIEDKNRLVLVIEHESTVRGFGVMRVLNHECELENLAIGSDWRRRGWGTILLKALIQLAQQRGSANVFLEVRESNLAARRLYNGYGFVENGRRTNYYREPTEDAILYRFKVGSRPVPAQAL